MPGKQETLTRNGPVVDPVCGVSVDPCNARHRAKLTGELCYYYFCSERCREQFVRDPNRYRVSTGGAAPMEREPAETPLAAIDPGPSPELAEMTRRFWIGVAFSFPLLVLEAGAHAPGLGFQPWLSPRASAWMQLGLATPVVLLAGWPIFVRGWASIVSRSLNIFTLIALGVGGAYAISVIATLSPRIFPEAFRRADGAVAVYFEAAAAVTVLVLLCQVLALRARERNRGVIRAQDTEG